MRDVQRAFDRLPPIQKEVVLLVAVEGMEYEDAAAVLGGSGGNRQVAPFASASRYQGLP